MDFQKYMEQQKVAQSPAETMKKSPLMANDDISMDEKELNRMMKQPFSRAMYKKLQIMDKLTSSDEYVKALYIQALKNQGSNDELNLEAFDANSLDFSGDGSGETSAEDEEISFTFEPVSLEAFKEKVAECVAKQIAKETRDKKMRLTLTHCGIPGCTIHSLTPTGDIARHYTHTDVVAAGEPEFIMAEEILLKERETYLECYNGRLVQHNRSGDVVRIYTV